jgi:hypothetical protein
VRDVEQRIAGLRRQPAPRAARPTTRSMR